MADYTLVRIIAVIVLILFGLDANSQFPRKISKPKENLLEAPYKGHEFRYYVYNYNINSNLSTNGIDEICVDTTGRLWYSTGNSGFAVLDGQSLFAFGTHNGLFDRFNVIHADRQGRVWAGGNGVGVVTFANASYMKWYVRIGKEISDVHIQDIVDDSEGNIWVSTRLGGISCIMEDTTLMYTSENSFLPEGYAHELAIDNSNRVWTRVNDTIFYFEDKILKVFDNYDRKKNKIKRLYGRYQDYVVGIDQTGDLFRVTPNGIELIAIDYIEEKPDRISWVRFDREGVMFFGNKNQVYRLINGKAHLILAPDLGNFTISDVCFDNNNSLWLSTTMYGLFYVPDFDLIRVTGKECLSYYSDKEMALFRNDKGEILALFIDQDNNFKWKTVLPNPENREIRHRSRLKDGMLLVDRERNLYFIDYNGVYHPEKGEKYKKFKFSNERFGLEYHIDREQNLWITDSTGFKPLDLTCKNAWLFHKEQEVFYLFIEKEDFWQVGKLQNDQITMVMDSVWAENLKVTGAHYINDTTFLFPTWGKFMFKNTPHTSENITENFGTNILYSTVSDGIGNFWTSGIEGGLNYVDGASDFVVNLNSTNGLPGGRVNGLTITDENDVVVTTNTGVGVLTLNDPDIIVNSEADFFKKYSVEFTSNSNGLVGEGFGTPKKDKSGRIWVKNKAGLAHIILPKKAQTKPTSIKFESIYLVNEKNEKTRLHNWLPGTAHNPGVKWNVSYNEGLLVNLKTIYFQNYSALTYQYKLDEEEWSLPQRSSLIKLSGFKSGDHQVSFRSINEAGLFSDELQLSVTVIPPYYQTAWFIIGMILLSLGLIYLLFRWRLHVLKVRQRELEDTVEERTEEIRLQKIEIETQHNEIKDSITYAKRIQEAILPPSGLIDKCLSDCFVLYKPKDVVAGDFYWVEEVGDKIIFAAADCTGHGVPGAMVSVVCHNALVRSVREFNLTEPEKILDKTRELVIERFEKGKQEVNDGMDISLCVWDRQNNTLKYAGANNSLYHFRQGELSEIKADKQPIGRFHDPKPFNSHTVEIQRKDTIYLFTDGYSDQFGGDKGKKFKSAHFKELLSSLQEKSMHHQMADIDRAFELWKGELEQVDDVCIIGVRI